MKTDTCIPDRDSYCLVQRQINIRKVNQTTITRDILCGIKLITEVRITSSAKLVNTENTSKTVMVHYCTHISTQAQASNL